MRKLPIRCVAFDVMSTREAEIPYTHASCLTKEFLVVVFFLSWRKGRIKEDVSPSLWRNLSTQIRELKEKMISILKARSGFNFHPNPLFCLSDILDRQVMQLLNYFSPILFFFFLKHVPHKCKQ